MRTRTERVEASFCKVMFAAHIWSLKIVLNWQMRLFLLLKSTKVRNPLVKDCFLERARSNFVRWFKKKHILKPSVSKQGIWKVLMISTVMPVSRWQTKCLSAVMLFFKLNTMCLFKRDTMYKCSSGGCKVTSCQSWRSHKKSATSNHYQSLTYSSFAL